MALGLALLVTGCFGLDKQERAVLDVHQQNSQMYFQSGSWLQALHQADMALELDSDLTGMRLIRGHCLVRLGSSRQNQGQLDKSIEIFDELATGSASDDYRSWLGAGQARLARARLTQQEIDRIDRRLGSDFLTEQGRQDEQQARDQADRQRVKDLRAAEHDLKAVLAFDVQQDNVYAMIDLALTLMETGGRADEASSWARRAVELLQDATALTRETLSKNMNLSPRGRLNMESRIDDYLDKEQMLRGVIITIDYNRGSYQRCLEDYASLEQRALMQASDYFNRAQVYENLGMWSQAIDDYQAFLREHSRDADYDEQAQQVFERIEALQQFDPAGHEG